MSTDSAFMQYALSLARRGLGNTSPNPSVGCVIVKDGKILGAANTAKGGRPHAETQALQQAALEAKGATAYVTLEPCSHYGKTPPCAESLIKAGISRVVISAIDPFAQVNGKGISMLKEAGIEVVIGVCEEEAQKTTEGFFSVIQKSRPFITLKTATSLDGKIALKDGSSKWITGEESRNHVHLMRARHDAIITGTATVMADNPDLTCRLPGMFDKSPIRIVLDTNLSIALTSKIVQTAKTVPCWVATLADTISSNHLKAKDLEQLGVRLLVVNKASNGKICVEDTVKQLAINGINNAMIEAGAKINTVFFSLKLVDRIAWFRAPLIIGNEGLPAFLDINIEKLSSANRLIREEHKIFGNDIFEKFRLSY